MNYHPIHQYAEAGETRALRGDPLVKQHIPQVKDVPALLTPDQVRDINEYALTSKFSRADVAQGRVDEAALPQDDFGWLYDGLWEGMQSAAWIFGLDITGMYEEAVVLRYGKKDQNAWHSDYDEDDRSKVAVTVLLNDHREYRGGDLEVLGKDLPPLIHAGDARFFGGFLAHRVTPVSKGVRSALVAWAGGPALR